MSSFESAIKTIERGVRGTTSATTKEEFDAAYDRYAAQDFVSTVNGAQLTREQHKDALWTQLSQAIPHGVKITFGEAISTLVDPQQPDGVSALNILRTSI